ncbi:MAG: hypothetical protein PHF58_10615 [Methylotenera sp.]|nr:hypothetical protein [Methylotenera sp.]
MNEITTRLNLIIAELSQALPNRLFSRDLKDFAQRQEIELETGIYTLLSSGEGGYQNLLGRAAQDGTAQMALLGQFKLPEDSAGSAVEDAELDMVQEIKDFLITLPPTLCRLQMTGFTQSKQLEAPFGWIVIDLQFIR